ncbi:OmpA family protein [Dyella silvatica]|uniref:OmpA family protein n=1 Tax=Dyella silvatica TaxID=2992128 RepID=UPI00225BFCA8|nr:OmpA family protein [Dyella silvatica]
MRTQCKGIIAVSIALVLAACGNVSHDVAKNGQGAGELVWPATDSVTPMHKGGTFPNLANLRRVRAGLNKQQLADLIGYPHFSEGVWGVREWNYVFNFRKPDTDEVTVCEYKVLFDDTRLARSFYWKPESCAAMLETAKPVAQTNEAPVVAPRVLSADALFAFDKAELSLTGRASLDALAVELRGRGEKLRAVNIAGYTDRLGNDAYNHELSLRRADAVKAYLEGRGVLGEHISTEGFGASHPVKDCPDSARAQLITCLAPNRRVEVQIDSVK